jgi:hypothetical protein
MARGDAMIDPWHIPGGAAPVPAWRLDQRSRQAVAGFLLRLCGVSITGLWPYLAGAQPLYDDVGTLSALCAIAGTVGLAWAMLGRETFGRGSLNRWDEALAFVALSRLWHLVHGLHA